MKVSIVTEGFQNTGYGHITRCLSLYQAFEEKKFSPVLFLNGDENSKSFSEGADFKLINWLSHPAQLVSEVRNSDVLIIDSYLAGKEYYDNLSKLSKVSLFIDDNLRLEYPEGIVLNGTINAESFPYPKLPGHDYLLGSGYIPVRKEFWNLPPKKFHQGIGSLLVTFGGQDNRNLTPSVIKTLEEKYPDITKNVVIGSGFPGRDELERLSGKNVNILRALDAGQMRELMLSNDIAISAAGQTLYELAAAGTPTIAIVTADNQRNNMNEWRKKGFFIDPIYFNDINLSRKIVDQVEALKSISLRKKLSMIGKENVKGQGSRKTVEFIIGKYCQKNLFYLRRAVKDDSQMVYSLSNDPSVRRQSISKESISWEDHLKWFDEKIADREYYFLLAFDKKGNFIGQIRFQIQDEEGVVSISVSDEFRGKGFSKRILQQACQKVFQEKSGVKSITAYIKPDNGASIGAFRGAGFLYTGETGINGSNFLKYVLAKGAL
jgi:UDP-2,4-diacetamido-2,4,6-trideoxy-beta-L-altropyranose hydrolase